MIWPICERISARGAFAALAWMAAAGIARSEEAAPAPSEYSAVLANVFPAIVRIEAIQTRPSDGHLIKLWTAGSGVIISPLGYVLTNFHVAQTGVYYRCYLTDGSKLEARRVGQDPLTDLAVLQMDLGSRAKDSKPLTVASFGDSDKLVDGETVFALGSPGFVEQSVTRGIVSNPSLVLPEETVGPMLLRGENVGLLVRWIFHDARIFGGNSGGPLINSKGEVVGINEIGIFNLSGAIPAALARPIAEELIAKGAIVRGWSGLSVEARLESDHGKPGVLVEDVAPDSPADKAGFRPGDVILACDGHPVEGSDEMAVAHFNRLETVGKPGDDFGVDFERDGKRQTVHLTLDKREPAEADDVELKGWGAVVRDLTRTTVREEHLKDRHGVWIENVRPAGPSGQAEPELRRGDVVLSVDGKPVANVAEIAALTGSLLKASADGTASALVSYRQSGMLHSSIVRLRASNVERNIPTQARKAWLGIATQPVSVRLGKRLAIESDGGALLTRVFGESPAEKAGLLVGDVILAVDDEPLTGRRAEDADELERIIRQYKAGTGAKLRVWRTGKIQDIPVVFASQPIPPAEMAWWEDEPLEYSARDLAFDDRTRMQLDPKTTGAIIDSAVLAGWAYLGGLRADDIVIQADDSTVASLEDFKRARETAVKGGGTWWVLLVRRGVDTTFVEINLKPARP